MMAVSLCVQAGATGLDGLHLRWRPRQALEASGELGAVEVLSTASFNTAERGARCAANVAANDGGVAPQARVQRAMLLCFLPVGCERFRERVTGRRRVHVGRVVDLCSAIVSN
jgi:hypothetical protein